MKRRIQRGPKSHFIQAIDHAPEKQLARTTAQLQRISRFLQIVATWNRKLVRATEALAKSIAHDTERERTTLKSRIELSELRSRFDSLTPREQQVMGLVVRGLLNKETAAELGTAEITVKVQRASVMRKMNARSITDLVRMAEKLQVLSSA